MIGIVVYKGRREKGLLGGGLFFWLKENKIKTKIQHVYRSEILGCCQYH
jgi:hypothetical protein